VTDLRLGRHVDHDPRSRAFAAPEPEPDDLAALVSVRHQRHIPVLDQGQVSSCTANAAVGALGTSPLWEAHHTPGMSGRSGYADEKLAVALYSDEQRALFGQSYPPSDRGGSGLAIAKVLKASGAISGYKHAFSLNACLAALAKQPVIIGISWMNDMFNPDADGRLHPTGPVAGGHEIVLDELDVENKRVWLTNSWGASWGVQGRAYLTWDDLGALLAQQGDCTVFEVAR
jgi:hypothetical protein